MLSKWISGNGSAYFDAVFEAVTRSHAQSNFRRNDNYNVILEHVGQELGDLYLSKLEDPEVIKVCLSSAEADTVGNPRTFTYNGAQISPTTIRYAKVAQDIMKFFPQFNTFESYAEIGVGYGGQIRFLSELCKARKARMRSFTLLDIQPVVLLAQAYLDNFDLYAQCRFLTKSQIERDGRWDIVVSNYAFSELSRDLQDEYLRNVITRSRNGYLTMNTGLPNMPHWTDDVVTIHDLLNMLPNAVIVREDPITNPANYIVVFGDHSLGAGVDVDEFLAGLSKS